jgi:hypothetical protein
MELRHQPDVAEQVSNDIEFTSIQIVDDDRPLADALPLRQPTTRLDT